MNKSIRFYFSNAYVHLSHVQFGELLTGNFAHYLHLEKSSPFALKDQQP